MIITRIEYDDIGPDINGFRRYRVYCVDAEDRTIFKKYCDDHWRDRELLVGLTIQVLP